jgi:hypothetical protein
MDFSYFGSCNFHFSNYVHPKISNYFEFSIEKAEIIRAANLFFIVNHAHFLSENL